MLRGSEEQEPRNDTLHSAKQTVSFQGEATTRYQKVLFIIQKPSIWLYVPDGVQDLGYLKFSGTFGVW